MAKKKVSTVEVKERKIETDSIVLSINITIPTKLLHISEALKEVGRIDSIEKAIENSVEDYHLKVYQIIAPEKSTQENKKQTGRPKKVIQLSEDAKF